MSQVQSVTPVTRPRRFIYPSYWWTVFIASIAGSAGLVGMLAYLDANTEHASITIALIIYVGSSCAAFFPCYIFAGWFNAKYNTAENRQRVVSVSLVVKAVVYLGGFYLAIKADVAYDPHHHKSSLIGFGIFASVILACRLFMRIGELVLTYHYHHRSDRSQP
jgi:hypothetical protein